LRKSEDELIVQRARFCPPVRTTQRQFKLIVFSNSTKEPEQFDSLFGSKVLAPKVGYPVELVEVITSACRYPPELIFQGQPINWTFSELLYSAPGQDL